MSVIIDPLHHLFILYIEFGITFTSVPPQFTLL
uniref:Uncharacterized protein n=1 Tax=Lepeophtheirus salmonis TaxID=72036 RepID=A0A0K2V0N2_LEPSM